MRIEPEISGVSVVLIGKFNPAIFTPAWFALHEILPSSVATNAKLQVVHEQVTAFSTDWLKLQVLTNSFSVETLQAPYIRLRDIVARVFKEHLHHTPLNAFGINRNVHFQAPSSTARDHLGRTLAPVEPWGECGQNLGLDGEHGGMTSLKMTRGFPEHRPTGDLINVTVEPSNKVGQRRLGVYVGINDHYTIDDSKPGSAMRLMELLDDNFEKSLKRSDDIVDHIMSLVLS